MVGEDITVTILGINGSQVRIGVAAPKDVRVDREEVHERIKREGLKRADDAEMHL